MHYIFSFELEKSSNEKLVNRRADLPAGADAAAGKRQAGGQDNGDAAGIGGVGSCGAGDQPEDTHFKEQRGAQGPRNQRIPGWWLDKVKCININ